MSNIRWSIEVNTRAFQWIVTLAGKYYVRQNVTNGDVTEFINILLLRQLTQTPGVDLSQSPYSEPKGVSNGKREAGD